MFGKTVDKTVGLTQEDVMKALNTCYSKAVDGIKPVSKSVFQLADEYLKKEKDPQKAASSMINNQIIKCTTSGFVTGLGGLVTLPATITANIGSVLYIQLRMIATTAYLAGCDIKSDQVQTMVYACLAGVSISKAIGNTAAKVGTKVALNLVTKIPGTTLTKINQKVGFRLVTKFGSKGAINLGKLIPVVGGVIGGAFDLADTKVIGSRSMKWFFNGDYSVDEK